MTYSALSRQEYVQGDFKIVPIRFEDRLDIMRWRNEQLYHLRQERPITNTEQDHYFDTVVKKLFAEEEPNQILFSFLKDERCIGYGGLVHINWLDRNAEISFIMDTSLEHSFFEMNWLNYLFLIETVAFVELKFKKIYTYSFDLRPRLYDVLNYAGYSKESRLEEHHLSDGRLIDVLIHSKVDSKLRFRKADVSDMQVTYKWAIDKDVRAYALNSEFISIDDHKVWFQSKIDNVYCLYYIAETKNQKVGSIRLDISSNGVAVISYLVDPKWWGNGIGKRILEFGIYRARLSDYIKILTGVVMKENEPSVQIFTKLNFKRSRKEESNMYNFELVINEDS